MPKTISLFGAHHLCWAQQMVHKASIRGHKCSLLGSEEVRGEAPEVGSRGEWCELPSLLDMACTAGKAVNLIHR